MQWENSLFNRLKDIQSHYFFNDGKKGDPLSKCYIMAYLASFLKLKNYVEIGVYKGRSLFSVAQAFKDNEGKAYGIEPLQGIDFEVMYNQVVMNTEVFKLSNVVEIIRKTSTEAAPYFKDIKIDMLHIHGNNDFKSVQADINNYTPLIGEGGIIVIDCINRVSIKRCYDQYKNDYIILFETNNFGILMKNQKNLNSAVINISDKLKNLYSRLHEIENKTKEEKNTVNVGVLAYNHEKYIVDCLNSIIIQKGDFNLNIIICEDKSTDGTAGIVENYINNVAVGKNVTFEYLKSEENLGMVKNLKRLLIACSKSRYTALIDGDDYWDDENKLQTHIDFMESHPECSISFDDIIIKNGNEYDFYNIQQQIKGDIFNTPDITSINFIGNISCCFYYSKYFNHIPNGFFEMFVGDWMLNIVFSMFGEIGHIRKAMTIYRKNVRGIWSGMTEYDKNKKTIELIDIYNKFLNYTYDEQFCNIRKFCELDYLGNRYLEPLLYRP
ncbi:MAG TPA: glycosyltransferase [Clostridium sp.]|uniref:glycosyltransferase n=1 Tax=Clostridium sp. TaxID=1506 RepID=UPI002F939AE9